MNIIVCIKQVPDTETQIKIGQDNKSIVESDIKWVMNPYDEFGVEEALLIKEKFGGEVTVVGLGPNRVTESIRTALAMGADKGILINDPAVEGSDSLGTAKALAAAIQNLDYDLIFTGQRGVDDEKAGTANSSIDYHDKWGYALQAGFDYAIAGNWSVNLDVKKLFLKADADTTVGGANVHASGHINPWLVGVGVGYRF